jgi:hypothetical protein
LHCMPAHSTAAQCIARALRASRACLAFSCKLCDSLTLTVVIASCLCTALITGLDTTDAYYPAYFKGTWECKSLTKEVEAPVGIDLFGGNRYYLDNILRAVHVAV